VKFSSFIIPEAIEAMRYDWDDDQGKFSFYLDRRSPMSLARTLNGPWNGCWPRRACRGPTSHSGSSIRAARR